MRISYPNSDTIHRLASKQDCRFLPAGERSHFVFSSPYVPYSGRYSYWGFFYVPHFFHFFFMRYLSHNNFVYFVWSHGHVIPEHRYHTTMLLSHTITYTWKSHFIFLPTHAWNYGRYSYWGFFYTPLFCIHFSLDADIMSDSGYHTWSEHARSIVFLTSNRLSRSLLLCSNWLR